MKIIVTGGAGFIGSNLIAHLLSQGHQVISIDNYYTGRKKNLENFDAEKNFSKIDQDVINPLSNHSKNLKVIEAIEGIDQIYHLACPASPIHYQKDPIQTLKTNIWGTVNMIELSLQNKARLLFTSTSEVYGDPLQHPQKESYWGNVNPIGVRSCYDEGKRVAETLCFDYHRAHSLDLRVVRIFNTYGENMLPIDGRVVSNFIIQALKGEDLTIYGDGSQTRSFCYVRDMVEGIVAMMNCQNFSGPVNLGNPVEMTVLELAQLIISLTGSSSKITLNPLPSDDPLKRKPNISLAEEKLNWQPKVSIEAGLKKTIAYFKKELEIGG